MPAFNCICNEKATVKSRFVLIWSGVSIFQFTAIRPNQEGEKVAFNQVCSKVRRELFRLRNFAAFFQCQRQINSSRRLSNATFTRCNHYNMRHTRYRYFAWQATTGGRVTFARSLQNHEEAVSEEEW